jgi:FkbM family methyltransferase
MRFNSKREKHLLLKESNNDAYGLRRIPADRLTQIMDIGANVGMVSIKARLLHPNSEIHSFEPCSRTYKKLVENTANMDINTYQLALGNPLDNKLSLHRGPLCRRVLHNTDELDPDTNYEEIICKPLHELEKEAGITVDKQTMLKIDCEGGEWSILGSEEDMDVIERAGVVSLEIHSRKDGPRDQRSPFYFIDQLVGPRTTKKLFRQFGMTIEVWRAGMMIMWDKEHYRDIFN